MAFNRPEFNKAVALEAARLGLPEPFCGEGWGNLCRDKEVCVPNDGPEETHDALWDFVERFLKAAGGDYFVATFWYAGGDNDTDENVDGRQLVAKSHWLGKSRRKRLKVYARVA
jgi:hypothetical protein